MRISAVETTILRLPIVQPNGDGLQDLLLIEIHTDEGVTGLGEAHTMPVGIDALIHAPVSQWAVQGLAELLIGEDPTDIDALWRLMWARCVSVLGGRGLALHALSGIDLALWDLAGKLAEKPLHKLLGPSMHEQVEVYASDLMPDSADALLRRAAELLKEGHRALKFGWGKLGHTAEEDVDLLISLRSLVGSTVRLMVDVGVPMPFADACWLADRLEPLAITFLEEPLDATDLDGYAALVARSSVPIAAGEREGGESGFIDLMDRARLPVVQPDLARCGGLTVALKVAAHAATRGTWVVPHCWSSDVLVAATTHFLTSLSQPPLLEFNVMQQPLRTGLMTVPLRPVNGYLSPPSGPGLGVELDRNVVDRLRWQPKRRTQA